MSICKLRFSSSTPSFSLIGLALIGLTVLVSGCAKPAEESRSTPVSETQNEHVNQTTAFETTSHPLVGVWLGQGMVDLNLVSLATNGLSATTQYEVESSAKVFLATEMAIEFKENGTMETAVEVVNKLGKRESGIGIATWEAVQTMTPGEYRVASVEEQADDSKVTDYKTYRVSEDGRTLTLLVDLPGVLGQCQPKIVLQKQRLRARIAKEQSASAELN